ncbi:MAG: bifunctional NADP-dependent methylenetetrahydromethanopterin dehydrogenase/methylenetetrahydrofolate dehydrogenase [Planctomycetota bacterium]|nr:MAG: bifunctional NADP-dependent methylenetetrahydromethanopterin dehydrogenase/methylenetetrahydrofolate dehydrogenase [Planctomycetota bacterium]
MSKPKILVQLDTDPQPSVFDSVVAVDAGVEHLLRHGGVTSEQVRDLTYGAMFTRGGDDLCGTAIFVGGSNVAAGEALLEAVQQAFFGPMRVSVMLDSNGANTTAAAAVLCAAKHGTLKGAEATVLAATGPVGSRVVRLLALEGARVKVGSRSQKRAAAVCEAVVKRVPEAQLTPCETGSAAQTASALKQAQIVIAAGAPGVELASAEARTGAKNLAVAIDLSAVPPVGLAGIEITDRAVERDGVACYGAIGVGGTKMKIHKAAIRQLFTAHDLMLDAEEIYRIGGQLDA